MKEHNQLDIANEEFTVFLTKKNLRKTTERFAILKRIYSADGFSSAESLFETMQEDYRVSLATIYNTLELLLECNLIVRHNFDGATAQYEKASGNSVRHHLVCTNCGRVREFSDKNIRIAIQSRRYANFKFNNYSLYVYGLCNNCLKKQKVTII
ncbi:MAG: transcriptional repressor [Prevotellaceae bacterium]|jgi:Fur family ferric uptake transcriptional regulator|nr:transcriptional repressor [Prevotellaceae bacterium]